MGVVFLYAAWTKLRESWALFAMAIDAYQLLPQWAVMLAARTLPWAELVLGLWLISGKWLRIAAPAASLLLLSFFVILIRSYVKGMQIDCGCFGSGDPISPLTLARDGGLLAACLLLTVLAFLRARRPSVDNSSQTT
jgi:uncharacterized membrane protein YphA (DoxX/SURF4 family)